MSRLRRISIARFSERVEEGGEAESLQQSSARNEHCHGNTQSEQFDEKWLTRGSAPSNLLRTDSIANTFISAAHHSRWLSSHFVLILLHLILLWSVSARFRTNTLRWKMIRMPLNILIFEIMCIKWNLLKFVRWVSSIGNMTRPQKIRKQRREAIAGRREFVIDFVSLHRTNFSFALILLDSSIFFPPQYVVSFCFALVVSCPDWGLNNDKLMELMMNWLNYFNCFSNLLKFTGSAQWFQWSNNQSIVKWVQFAARMRALR